MADSRTSFLTNINHDLEERAVQERAEKLNMGYVNLLHFTPNQDIFSLVSEEQARQAGIFPLALNGTKIRLAVPDPNKKGTSDFLLALKEKKLVPELFLCSETAFAHALLAYKSDLLHHQTVARTVSFNENTGDNLKTKIASLGELEKTISQLPAETALSEIEIAAVRAGASDIHFQPNEKGATLRLRVDGILHSIFDMAPDITHKLLTRVKYEAGMRSNISDLPQDGHITFPANDRKIDLRVSTLPTPFGESVVLRVLDPARGIQSFTELGFSEHVREKLLASLHQKNGLILVTGPTGCGKTTTLYSMLSELNLPDRKIVTLEDPIEYELPGISQSQVDEERAYNFDNGLAAMLRHDPDVILVGEIRTHTTARLASEAALTGHVVLSSLHTNSAIGAVSRLRNLGLENFNMAPALGAVFAQRLVRKVCDCATETDLPQDPKFQAATSRLQQIFPNMPIPSKLKKFKGCEKCSGTGYMGRMAICEAFLLTDEIRALILDQKSETEILNVLRGQGFLTLFEDGVMKVLQGQTTLEELFRVAS